MPSNGHAYSLLKFTEVIIIIDNLLVMIVN